MALLPGQALVNGVSNFVAGVNMSQDFATNTVRNTPQIQALIKSAGFQLMRCAIPDPSTNAYIDLTANACVASGCQMLVILNHSDLAWNQHLVSYLGTRCSLYEFSNEPDLLPLSWQSYLSFWNQHIPALRSINPGAAYIGPVLGVFANLQSYLVPWLQGCKTSGVLPDAVSYHIYPCTSQPSRSTCATKSTSFTSAAGKVDAAVSGVLGYTLPQALTEWNIDASAPVQSYVLDPTFVSPWLSQAFDNLVSANLAMTCYWDAGSNAAGGADDLVNTSTFQPQIQYAPMQTAIAKYFTGGGGGGGSLSASPSTLQFSGLAGGSVPAQSVTLSNSGSASLPYTATPSVNWLTVSPTSGTVPGNGSISSAISASLTNPAGSYSGAVSYVSGAISAAVMVALKESLMANIALLPSIVTNVVAFGADPTGAISSDPAITLALATIPTSTGGVLYFPPNGTYLTSGIDISAYGGNLDIMGGGWSSVLKLASGANSYIIKNTSGAQQGTRISNLKLDCNSANQTSASGGIYGYKYRRCLIDFVYILNPWQAGIYLIGDSGDFGYQNRIVHNFIIGGDTTTTGANAYGEGLRLENTDENMVALNHFEANGNPNDSTYGFHIYDKNGLSSYFGNSFVNGMGVFKLDGLQCSIISNKFDGNGGACAQLNGSAADTIIAHNTAINVGYQATGGTANSINGIYVNATRCIVQGNYFESDGSATPKTHSFVNIDTGATDLICEHNTFNVKTGSGTVVPISFASSFPSRARVRENTGFNSVTSVPAYLTENYGSANITSGNTTVTVSHGLALTPTLSQIHVTPQTSFGSASTFWINNVTSTQFTINLNSNPGQTVTFGWIVNAGY